MAEIISYPLGNAAADSQLIGTQLNVPQADGTKANLTRNFSISNIAPLITQYNLGYTVYVAKFSQSGSGLGGAPVVSTELQNTTGLTFTYTRNSQGVYDIAPSTNFGKTEKVYVVVGSYNSTSTNARLLSVKEVTTGYIRLSNIDIANQALADTIDSGTIEIRIYN